MGYRKKKKLQGCNIKGSIEQRSRIFAMPGNQFKANLIINKKDKQIRSTLGQNDAQFWKLTVEAHETDMKPRKRQFFHIANLQFTA